MKDVDTASFEKKVHLRPVRIEDFDQLVALQLLCFPGMQTWGRDHIESQLEVFPEGQFCIEYEGAVVASCSTLMLDYDDYEDWHDWAAVADRGYIRNHDPEGDTLYGIEIMVHPDFRGMRLARRLYDARKDLARHLNAGRIIIGGRIPGYGAHADKMTAREYVEQVIDRKLTDPVLTAQLANGFVLKQLVPEYYPSDDASRGYATFLDWINLDYVAERKRRMFAVSRVRVGVVQYQMRSIDDFDDFAQQVAFFVDTVADQKADFVLFPALLTTQLLSFSSPTSTAQSAMRLAEYTSRYLDLFNRLAIRHNTNIIGGSQLTVEDGQLYGVSYLFRRDGSIGKQYKLHVTPAEKRWWGVQPGSRLEVFETDSAKIAILIGYDVQFPELARLAAARGAQILFVPYSAADRTAYLRIRYCAQARCVENHVYVAATGCVGSLPFVDNADVHYSQAAIFTPTDITFAREGIAGECTPAVEAVMVQDVDLELLRRARATGTVRNWHDRRKDLYRLERLDGEEPEEV